MDQARDIEAMTGIQFDRVIEGCLMLVGVFLLQGALVYVQNRVLDLYTSRLGFSACVKLFHIRLGWFR